jgi:molybdenum cofactor biosynthesis enzyme
VHRIGLGLVEVSLKAEREGIGVRSLIKTEERIGMEMEALTAAGVAASAFYQIVKGVERGCRSTVACSASQAAIAESGVATTRPYLLAWL